MPPVPLSANQVSDVVAFVKSRVAAADIRSANRGIAGSPDKLLTGNAEAGKAFFQVRYGRLWRVGVVAQVVLLFLFHDIPH